MANMIYYSVGILFVILLVLLFLLYSSDKKLGFWKNLFQLPTKYYSNVQHEDEVAKIIQIIPYLSMEELEIILTHIWGRPVRLVKGRDKSGACWIETVSYFEAEGDQNYHFQQLKKEDKRSEIG